MGRIVFECDFLLVSTLLSAICVWRDSGVNVVRTCEFFVDRGKCGATYVAADGDGFGFRFCVRLFERAIVALDNRATFVKGM